VVLFVVASALDRDRCQRILPFPGNSIADELVFEIVDIQDPNVIARRALLDEENGTRRFAIGVIQVKAIVGDLISAPAGVRRVEAVSYADAAPNQPHGSGGFGVENALIYELSIAREPDAGLGWYPRTVCKFPRVSTRFRCRAGRTLRLALVDCPGTARGSIPRPAGHK
jgi:hypothetical protein